VPYWNKTAFCLEVIISSFQKNTHINIKKTKLLDGVMGVYFFYMERVRGAEYIKKKAGARVRIR
jgi:hypothetical protein